MVVTASLLLLSAIGSVITAPSSSTTPELTPEVQLATEEFLQKFASAKEGGLAALQQQQIPNVYIAELPVVDAARSNFLQAFQEAENGEHAAKAPVFEGVQAPQIANAFIEDTPEVIAAKNDHLAAVQVAEEGGLAHLQAEQIPNLYIADVEQVAAAKASFNAAFEKAATAAAAAVAEPVTGEDAVVIQKAAPLPTVYQQPLILPYQTIAYPYQVPVKTYQIPQQTYQTAVHHYQPHVIQLVPFSAIAPVPATQAANTVEEGVAVEEA